MTDLFGGDIESALVFMELGDPKKGRGPSHMVRRITPKYFRGAIPLAIDSAVSAMEQSIGGGEGFFADATIKDLGERFDVSALGSWIGGPDGGFTAARYRSLDLKDVRGRTNRHYRHVVEIAVLFIDPNAGSCIPEVHIYGSMDGREWRQALSGFEVDDDRKFSSLINLMCGVQFSRYYLWSVEIGTPGAGSVSFLSSPQAIKDVFKMRDVPADRQRRSSLRNWVRDHWRTIESSTTDEELEAYVRKHLRGAVSFTWDGLDCRIIPSRDALREAKRAIEERPFVNSPRLRIDQADRAKVA